MQDAQTIRRLSSWRDGAFLTTEAAGQILGYSAGNVRDLIFFGLLKAIRHTPAGRLYVTVPSVVALVDAAEPVDPATLASKVPRPERSRRPKLQSAMTAAPTGPTLRLVVNNDRATP